MLENGKYSGKITTQNQRWSLLEKMGGGWVLAWWGVGCEIKKMAREGLLGNMTFVQKHEEGEGVEQASIWGRVFQAM